MEPPSERSVLWMLHCDKARRQRKIVKSNNEPSQPLAQTESVPYLQEPSALVGICLMLYHEVLLLATANGERMS